MSVAYRYGPLTRELLLAPGGFGLGQVPARLKPDATTTLVCGYCSTGCGLSVHLRDGQAVNLTPGDRLPREPGHGLPEGLGGAHGPDSPDRATTPLLRECVRPTGAGRLADGRVDAFCSAIQSHSGNARPGVVAFLSTGQIVTEEMALLGALAKFGMGMLHGDGNTRQCMATSVVAYKQSFGFDAPPYTYADFEESDVIVLVGSNLCLAHPILWERVMRNPHRPEIVVIDPRLHRDGDERHAAPAAGAQIGSDAALRRRPAADRVAARSIATYIDRHTAGFDEFAAFVQDVHARTRRARKPGWPRTAIERLAEIIRRGKRVSFWWTMGVNQSHQGVRTAQAIINLALMTGNIGRPGTGANSITGQCNAMGSRLFSNTTNLLGGHDFANPEHRRKVAGILEIDEARIPHEASWAYHRDPGRHSARQDSRPVGRLHQPGPFVDQPALRPRRASTGSIFSSCRTCTTRPRRPSWPTSCCRPPAGARRKGRSSTPSGGSALIKKVAPAPGQALSDFRIFRLVADAWGCGEMFRRWTSPAAVFELLKRLSAGQPCDITGIRDYRMLAEQGGIQWPLPRIASRTRLRNRAAAVRGRPLLHARWPCPVLVRSAATLIPKRRRSDIRSCCSPAAAVRRSGTRRPARESSAVLRKLYPESPFVEINPDDARRLGHRAEHLGDRSSRSGASMRAKAFLTPAVQPGQVFVPMHYAAHQPAHPCGLRPLLAAALVQDLRRASDACNSSLNRSFLRPIAGWGCGWL